MLSNGGKVGAGWLARDRAEFLRRPFSGSAAGSANIIARTRKGGDAGITETNVASSGEGKLGEIGKDGGGKVLTRTGEREASAFDV